MKVSDVLTDESKWVKGTLRRDQRRCLAGALAFVYPKSKQYVAARRHVVEVARLLFPERFPARKKGDPDRLPEFNDHPDTMFEDVQRVVKVADV